jgi:ubiquinone/menaquinone biosynthesis C-methylase UbiE
MKELYENRFSQRDPYGLDKAPEWKIINDYKIDLLHRLFPPAGTYRRSLDVGCGDAGIFNSHRQCKGTEFSVSLDLSFNAVRRCRGHHAGSATSMYFVVGDAQDLPFAQGVFDFVYCSEVLEHLVDSEKGLDEIHRVLEPGAEAVITVPNEKERILNPEEHISSFTYYTFKGAVSERFEIQEEKGLYLNSVDPHHLLTASDPESLFEELLRSGESRPDESLGLILKVRPLTLKSAMPDGVPLEDAVFSYISRKQLDACARILFPYRPKSRIPLLGPLIAWVRVNITSHLKEPYVDRLAMRQTEFNLVIARMVRRIVGALESSQDATPENTLTLRQKQEELEVQLQELRLAVDDSHRELKEELEGLKSLLGAAGESSGEGDSQR